MKVQISRAIAAVAVGLTVAGSAGCLEPNYSEVATSSQEQLLQDFREADDCDGKSIRVAWLGTVPSNAFDGAELQGAKDQAARMKGTVQPFYSNFDPALQLQQCNDAVRSRKFDAIVVIPMSSSGIIPCVANAKAAGIPVVATQVAIGADPASIRPQVPGQVGAVLTPVAKFGSELTALTVSQCGQTSPCNVVYLAGSFGVSIDAIAIQNLNTAIAAHPNMHLVAQREVYWDAGLAQTAMQEILTQNRNIQVVVTSGDQMTQGAEVAINAAQLPVRPKLIGAGIGGFAIDSIRAGRWEASFVVLPYDEGWLGTQIAIRAARGKRIKTSGIDPVARRGFPAFYTTENQALFNGFIPQWPG